MTIRKSIGSPLEGEDGLVRDEPNSIFPSQKGTSVTASDLVELAWKLEATAKALNANHGELLLCDLLREAASALRERIPLPADGGAREALDTYDAGLLNDWGGGNVEWWQDYIRAELGRAHDFYAAQFDRLALHPSSRGEAEQK